MHVMMTTLMTEFYALGLYYLRSTIMDYTKKTDETTTNLLIAL